LKILLVTFDRDPDVIPLGLAYIAGFLEHRGIDVRLVDAGRLGLSEDRILDIIAEERFRMVGMSVATHFHPAALRFFSRVKALNPEIVTVAGGPHPTALPEESVRSPVLDYAVLGEGEKTVEELARCIERGDDPEGVAGIAFNRGGNFVKTGSRSYIQNLDSLPFPLWRQLPVHLYRFPHLPRKNHVRIMAARGCPYNCAFCAASCLWGRRMRWRSPGNVVSEIELLENEFGVHSISFADSTFTADRDWVMDFCRCLIERNIDVGWMANARGDCIDSELVGTMKEAGCKAISVGVESGDPRILKNMRKGETVEQIRRAFHIIRNAGLISRGCFILGYPGESIESIENTIRFAVELNPSHPASCSYATPYPGSELYQIALRENGIRTGWEDFTHFNSAIRHSRVLPYVPEGLTENDLISARRRFIRRVMLGKLIRLRAYRDFMSGFIHPLFYLIGDKFRKTRSAYRARRDSSFARGKNV